MLKSCTITQIFACLVMIYSCRTRHYNTAEDMLHPINYTVPHFQAVYHTITWPTVKLNSPCMQHTR